MFIRKEQQFCKLQLLIVYWKFFFKVGGEIEDLNRLLVSDIYTPLISSLVQEIWTTLWYDSNNFVWVKCVVVVFFLLKTGIVFVL